MVTGLSSLNIEDTWRVYPVTMVISVISCGTKTNQPNTAGLSLQLLLLLNEILWIRRWSGPSTVKLPSVFQLWLLVLLHTASIVRIGAAPYSYSRMAGEDLMVVFYLICFTLLASSPGHSQIFISQLWRKIGRRPEIKTMSQNRKWWTRLVQTESALHTNRVHHFRPVT